jgi:hypothetical protein
MRGPPDLTAAAAKRLRRAVAGLRGAKHSIGKARTWLPACELDLDLTFEVKKIREVEIRLLALVAKLYDTERFATRDAEAPPRRHRKAA